MQPQLLRTPVNRLPPKASGLLALSVTRVVPMNAGFPKITVVDGLPWLPGKNGPITHLRCTSYDTSSVVELATASEMAHMSLQKARLSTTLQEKFGSLDKPHSSGVSGLGYMGLHPIVFGWR